MKEEVNRAIDLFLRSVYFFQLSCSHVLFISKSQLFNSYRSSDDQSLGSRPLQLQFQNSLPLIVYTGNKIVSVDGSPLKFVLYDSTSKKIVTCGPMKVKILVLEGDFIHQDWSKDDFDAKLVHNRQDKRPLLTGETIVSLQDGIGFIHDVTFTDNSSWIRSGKFRLGVDIHSDFDGTSIRQGVSNAFRVKDHRGECMCFFSLVLVGQH